jgi:redox-sensitive bicupin YhaK (pirin superfamily)
MKPASYRDIQPAEILHAELPGGGDIKVIAGNLQIDGRRIAGPIQGVSTAPTMVDVNLPSGAFFSHAIAADHNAFIYPYEGDVLIGESAIALSLKAHTVGILSPGDQLKFQAAEQGARFLFLAARPIGEPVAQHGPFVMNTREEIEQAVADYRSGRLTSA